MTFNCLTLFPDLFAGFAAAGLVGRAVRDGLVTINLIDFRDYTDDKHGRVDDYPFSGGPGMLLMPQPLFDCFEDLGGREHGRVRRIYMSPAGRPFTQRDAERLVGSFDTVDSLCSNGIIRLIWL